jgi:transcriptional regulator with XRE-family HTH domain
MSERFGELFKKLRIASGQNLRSFCRDHQLDAGNMSKIERGKMGPPESEEKLKELAAALKLDPSSQEWRNFLDLAAAERGRVPSDILSDREMVGALPVLYRTLRGDPVDGASLDELINKIRRA